MSAIEMGKLALIVTVGILAANLVMFAVQVVADIIREIGA